MSSYEDWGLDSVIKIFSQPLQTWSTQELMGTLHTHFLHVGELEIFFKSAYPWKCKPKA